MVPSEANADWWRKERVNSNPGVEQNHLSSNFYCPLLSCCFLKVTVHSPVKAVKHMRSSTHLSGFHQQANAL